MKQFTKDITVCMLIITVFSLAIWLAWSQLYRVEHDSATVKFDNAIEKVVSVKDLDNKFVEWKTIGLFGGGGAGGQGSFIVWAKSAEQFMEEVKPGEKIYTEVKKLHDSYDLGQRPAAVQKTYIAGVENRNMLLGFEDVYTSPGTNEWRVASFNEDEVVFKQTVKPGQGWAIFITIVSVIIIAVTLALALAVIEHKLQRHYTKSNQISLS